MIGTLGNDSVTLTLIAAMARDRTIGRDGEMPWRLPGDLAHFKQTTMGHGLVLGRKTWEATGALPGRYTVVMTRRRGYRAGPGALVEHDLARAVKLASLGSGRPEVFIGGGEEIYRQALPHAHRAVLTRIDAEISGDTHFPDLPVGEWRKVSSEDHPASERDPYPWTVEVWERTGALDVSRRP